MQFALTLLLLFATGCRLVELVDTKKKKRQAPGLDDGETCANDMDDKGFDNTKAGANADFGFDNGNNHDSAIIDLGSENGDDSSDDNVIISDY